MKRMKKIVSILLAMVMVLGMSLTAFAENGEYDLTIKTVKGHTYKIYQLAKGEVSEDGTKLSNIKVGDNAADGVIVDQIKGLANLSGAELGKAAESLLDTEKAPKATIVSEKGDDISQTLPGGYYVILDSYTDEDASDPEDGSDSLSRVMVTLVKDTEMIPKDTTIAPDKKIVETTTDDDGNETEDLVDTNEAAIGDTITYRLSGLVPDMQDYKVFKYVLVDTMSPGLTPNFKEGDVFSGKVGTKEAKFTVTSMVKADDGKTTIRIAFQNAIEYADLKGETVSVDITATLNSNAVVAPSSNPNTLKIEYSNNPNQEYEGDSDDDFEEGEPKGETPEVTVQTFTTQLTITKVVGGTENDETPEILQGAEFQLESVGESINVGYVTGKEYVEDENGTWYKLVDGAYTETEPTETTANKYADTTTKYILKDVDEPAKIPSNVSVKAFVDESGKVVFTGLGVGTYILKETTTPDGYNTMDDITFKVTWTKDKGFSVVILDQEGNETDKTDITVSQGETTQLGNVMGAIIPNYSGSLLPSTGGIGTTIFTLVGAVLIISAGVLLVVKKRMSKN